MVESAPEATVLVQLRQGELANIGSQILGRLSDLAAAPGSDKPKKKKLVRPTSEGATGVSKSAVERNRVAAALALALPCQSERLPEPFRSRLKGVEYLYDCICAREPRSAEAGSAKEGSTLDRYEGIMLRLGIQKAPDRIVKFVEEILQANGSILLMYSTTEPSSSDSDGDSDADNKFGSAADGGTGKRMRESVQKQIGPSAGSTGSYGGIDDGNSSDGMKVNLKKARRGSSNGARQAAAIASAGEAASGPSGAAGRRTRNQTRQSGATLWGLTGGVPTALVNRARAARQASRAQKKGPAEVIELSDSDSDSDAIEVVTGGSQPAGAGQSAPFEIDSDGEGIAAHPGSSGGVSAKKSKKRKKKLMPFKHHPSSLTAARLVESIPDLPVELEKAPLEPFGKVVPDSRTVQNVDPQLAARAIPDSRWYHRSDDAADAPKTILHRRKGIATVVSNVFMQKTSPVISSFYSLSACGFNAIVRPWTWDRDEVRSADDAGELDPLDPSTALGEGSGGQGPQISQASSVSLSPSSSQPSKSPAGSAPLAQSASSSTAGAASQPLPAWPLTSSAARASRLQCRSGQPGLAYAGGIAVQHDPNETATLTTSIQACQELMSNTAPPVRAVPEIKQLTTVLAAMLLSPGPHSGADKRCAALADRLQRDGLLGQDTSSPLRKLLNAYKASKNGEQPAREPTNTQQVVYLGSNDVTSGDRVFWKFPAQQFSPSIEMIPSTLERLSPGSWLWDSSVDFGLWYASLMEFPAALRRRTALVTTLWNRTRQARDQEDRAKRNAAIRRRRAESKRRTNAAKREGQKFPSAAARRPPAVTSGRAIHHKVKGKASMVVNSTKQQSTMRTSAETVWEPEASMTAPVMQRKKRPDAVPALRSANPPSTGIGMSSRIANRKRDEERGAGTLPTLQGMQEPKLKPRHAEQQRATPANGGLGQAFDSSSSRHERKADPSSNRRRNTKPDRRGTHGGGGNRRKNRGSSNGHGRSRGRGGGRGRGYGSRAKSRRHERHQRHALFDEVTRSAAASSSSSHIDAPLKSPRAGRKHQQQEQPKHHRETKAQRADVLASDDLSSHPDHQPRASTSQRDKTSFDGQVKQYSAMSKQDRDVRSPGRTSMGSARSSQDGQQHKERLGQQPMSAQLAATSFRLDVATHASQRKPEARARSPSDSDFGVGSNEDELLGRQSSRAGTLIPRPSASDPPSNARARGASEGLQGSNRPRPSASQPSVSNSLMNLSQKPASSIAAGKRSSSIGGASKSSGQVPMGDDDDVDAPTATMPSTRVKQGAAGAERVALGSVPMDGGPVSGSDDVYSSPARRPQRARRPASQAIAVEGSSESDEDLPDVVTSPSRAAKGRAASPSPPKLAHGKGKRSNQSAKAGKASPGKRKKRNRPTARVNPLKAEPVGCQHPGKPALKNRMMKRTFYKVDSVRRFIRTAEHRHHVNLTALGTDAWEQKQSFDPTEAMAQAHAEKIEPEPESEEDDAVPEALDIVKTFGAMTGYVDPRRLPGAYERRTLPLVLVDRMMLPAEDPMHVSVDDVLSTLGSEFNPFSRQFVFLPFQDQSHFSMAIICNAAMALPSKKEVQNVIRRIRKLKDKQGGSQAVSAQQTYDISSSSESSGEVEPIESQAHSKKQKRTVDSAGAWSPDQAGPLRLQNQLQAARQRARSLWDEVQPRLATRLREANPGTAAAEFMNPFESASKVLGHLVQEFSASYLMEVSRKRIRPSHLPEEMSRAVDCLIDCADAFKFDDDTTEKLVRGMKNLDECCALFTGPQTSKSPDSNEPKKSAGEAGAESSHAAGGSASSSASSSARSSASKQVRSKLVPESIVFVHGATTEELEVSLVRALSREALVKLSAKAPSALKAAGRQAEGVVAAVELILSGDTGDSAAGSAGMLRVMHSFLEKTADYRQSIQVVHQILLEYAKRCDVHAPIPRHPLECIRYGVSPELAGQASGANSMASSAASSSAGPAATGHGIEILGQQHSITTDTAVLKASLREVSKRHAHWRLKGLAAAVQAQHQQHLTRAKAAGRAASMLFAIHEYSNAMATSGEDLSGRLSFAKLTIDELLQTAEESSEKLRRCIIGMHRLLHAQRRPQAESSYKLMSTAAEATEPDVVTHWSHGAEPPQQSGGSRSRSQSRSRSRGAGASRNDLGVDFDGAIGSKRARADRADQDSQPESIDGSDDEASVQSATEQQPRGGQQGRGVSKRRRKEERSASSLAKESSTSVASSQPARGCHSEQEITSAMYKTSFRLVEALAKFDRFVLFLRELTGKLDVASNVNHGLYKCLKHVAGVTQKNAKTCLNREKRSYDLASKVIQGSLSKECVGGSPDAPDGAASTGRRQRRRRSKSRGPSSAAPSSSGGTASSASESAAAASGTKSTADPAAIDDERLAQLIANSSQLRYESDRAVEPPAPCIILLDSIKGHHDYRKYAVQIRKYCQLMYEHTYAPAEYTQYAEEARKQGLPATHDLAPKMFLQDQTRFHHVRLPNAPQQPNSCDCGVFTVQFCRQWILRALGPHITARVIQDKFKHSMFLGADMFDISTIPQLRQQLARTATELAMDKMERVDKVEARRVAILAEMKREKGTGASSEDGGTGSSGHASDQEEGGASSSTDVDADDDDGDSSSPDSESDNASDGGLGIEDNESGSDPENVSRNAQLESNSDGASRVPSRQALGLSSSQRGPSRDMQSPRQTDRVGEARRVNESKNDGLLDCDDEEEDDEGNGDVNDENDLAETATEGAKSIHSRMFTQMTAKAGASDASGDVVRQPRGQDGVKDGAWRLGQGGEAQA